MENIILLILIPGLAQFIAHLFGYGNPLSFIKERIARKVLGEIHMEEFIYEDYELESYESEYGLWDRIYDRASYHSFFMRLFNCSLCLSSWVVIFICLFMWINPIFILGTNYLIWKKIQ